MSNSIAAARQSTPRNELDQIQPVMAKAVNHSQFRLMPLVRLGLVKACGSLKSAAIDMDIDQGQLTRELESGKFKFERLERLQPIQQAMVFAVIHAECVPMATPLSRLREITRQIHQLHDEAMQIAEGLAS